jgi:hypothetical protein
MTTTGWQIREALKTWELRKGLAEKLFPESLHKFKDEAKDSPQAHIEAYLTAELAIAKLQVAQMKYNLAITVLVDKEEMSLAEAIKRVGSAGRVEKMWGSVKPASSRSRYMDDMPITRDPNQERAESTLTVKESTKLAEQASKRASAFRAAINTGNGREVEIANLDPALFE